MNESIDFERALAELESVVEQLQKPDVPLEKAVALYRRGTELAQKSEEMLSAAELQVQTLTSAVQERFAAYETDDQWEEEAED
ncbi:MAG TPA: exodeoxyribonuclease VII small subunit [Chloroflexota bacterium]